MHAPPRDRRRTRRPGFTLIEVVVVILIILVLMGLLIPAITGAIRTAKNAAVTADCNTMSQALEAFKTKYGEYPPSRIILSENGWYDTGTLPTSVAPTTYVLSANAPTGADITYAQLAARSVYYLRKFWPRVQLSTTGPAPNITATNWYDFNGNGRPDFDTDNSDGFLGTVLEGDECLAFFLGGIPLNTAAIGAPPEWSVSGFGNNPANPFSNNDIRIVPPATAPNPMYSNARATPFMEFKAERLVDPDGDGFLSYLDSLGTGRPFAYFSSYGNDAYDPNDMNVGDERDAVEPPTMPFMRLFRVPFVVRAVAGVDGSGNKSNNHVAISASPNPYTTSLANQMTTTTWQKPQSYQIISAGADGQYGAGGQYDPRGIEHLDPEPNCINPGPPASIEMRNLSTKDDKVRDREADNLSNFATGKLQ